MVKQNIYETHIHPHLSLISELLLQLSGWCSALHATEWIIDFLPTWEIPLAEYHPTSVSPNICTKMSFLGGNANTKPHCYFFNDSLKCLPDDEVSNYFSGGEIILDCLCKTTVILCVCVLNTDIMISTVYTWETTGPHWQRDRQCCVRLRFNMIINSTGAMVILTVGCVTTSQHNHRKSDFTVWGFHAYHYINQSRNILYLLIIQEALYALVLMT